MASKILLANEPRTKANSLAPQKVKLPETKRGAVHLSDSKTHTPARRKPNTRVHHSELSARHRGIRTRRNLSAWASDHRSPPRPARDSIPYTLGAHLSRSGLTGSARDLWRRTPTLHAHQPSSPLARESSQLIEMRKPLSLPLFSGCRMQICMYMYGYITFHEDVSWCA